MDRPSALSIIIDLSPYGWSQSPSFPLSSFISHLLAFINAFIAAKHENTLAVFGAFPAKSVMLTDPSTNTPHLFHQLDHHIVNRIKHELDSIPEHHLQAPIELVGALTKALCYINRLTIEANAATAGDESLDPVALADPRILILSVSPDLTSAYIPIMNSIFSAQKLKVTIDACQISGPENVFLQQATHLTGGSYIYAQRLDALLQYLTMALLSPLSVRKVIAVPTQDKIDFRATCFCHKNIVDIGFVCSVCLSIFCQPVPVCSTCRTKFPIKTLQRLNSSRPPASTSDRTPSATPRPSSTPRLPNVLPRSTAINVNSNMNGHG